MEILVDDLAFGIHLHEFSSHHGSPGVGKICCAYCLSPDPIFIVSAITGPNTQSLSVFYNDTNMTYSRDLKIRLKVPLRPKLTGQKKSPSYGKSQ
jgi:hypothetical protein